MSALAILGACSSSASAPEPRSRASPAPNPEYSGFLAASEFVVGKNRFPFALLSAEGRPLEDAQVQVRFYSLQRQPPDFRFEALATFRRVEGVTPHRHDDGQIHDHVEVRGIYVVDPIQIDATGFWGAEFAVTTSSGEQPRVQDAAFEVLQEPQAPGVGEPVPASHNLTLADVESIEEIETRVPPDNMHDLSVAQALKEHKPFVVVIATPMFCLSRMCGPVTDVAAALHARYRDEVNFLHIEPWNLTVARSEGQLVPTDIFLEWNLPSEPWVFVVGDDGRVVARFEGLVSSQEMEAAILAMIGETRPG